MSLLVGGVDQNVIQIGENPVNSGQDRVNQAHERAGGPAEPESESLVDEDSPGGRGGRLLDIRRVDQHIVERVHQINL